MPRDFLDDNDSSSDLDKMMPGRDFLMDSNPQPQESLGRSLVNAPYRIGEDLYKGAMDFAKNVPDYLKSSETEVPGVLNPLNFHPLHRAGQVTAGLAELGHGLLNAPRGIADYAANRLNLIPQSIAQKIPFQKDISGDINQLFGGAQYPGDSLIRGATRNALGLIPAGEAISVFNPINLTAKSIAKDVLDTAADNKKIYGYLYNNLWQDAENKGFGDALNNVDIDMKTLTKFSPQKSIKGVVDFNNNPTLQNAHAAKSDLLRIQRDLTRLPTLRSAERQQLKAVSEGIDSIQNNMFKNANGQIDQNLLDKYNAIQQGYANEVIPYRNKAINKFKRNEISANELVNSLSSGEFAAKRGNFHPEIKYRNALKNHPYLTGAAGLGLGKMVYDNMFGNQPSE